MRKSTAGKRSAGWHVKIKGKRERMHRVKRAVILAAGIGKRMRPVTLETPKPLIGVNGVRMIDTAIRALHENGIKEIYVVTGYKKEKFYTLEKQYQGLWLVENPYYSCCNNISSLYAARNYIEDAMVLDGDQVIHDAGVLAPEFEKSGYNSVWTDGETGEWLQQARDGTVISCSRTGGKGGWQLYSISRWTEADGQRLKRHLELEFEEKRNRQIYWDDIALFCHPQDYELGIWPMKAGSVQELDSLAELAALDSSYQIYMEDGKNGQENTEG